MLLKIIKNLSLVILALMILIAVIIIMSVPLSKIDSYELPFPVKNENLAITNVFLVNLKGDQPQQTQTVLIKDGIIVKIQDSKKVIGAEYLIKDTGGAFIMPGLIDTHTHIFDKSDLTLNLAHGVTSVRNMMGFPMHLRWKKEITEGSLLGPNLYTSSPTINSGVNTSPFHKNIKSADEIKDLVKQYKNEGYDLIKFYDGLSQKQFDVLVKEAAAQQIAIAGHPPRAVEFNDVLSAKPRSLEHVEELYQGVLDHEKDEQKATELAKLIAESGVIIVPTLSPYHHIYLAATEPEKLFAEKRRQYINPLVQFISEKQLGWVNEANYSKSIRKKDQFLGLLVTKLAQANAKMALGTDAGPSMTIQGKSVIEEIMMYKKFGLTNKNILEMATINAAEVIGVEENKGSIEINKDADLLLLFANPLEQLDTLENPKAVIKKWPVVRKRTIKSAKRKWKKTL